MTVKAGDVWVKAAYCGEDRIGLPAYEPFDVRNVIPHSDALPAVARWLADHPGAGEAMRRIVNNAWYETPCEADDLDWLHALAEALTGGEGAGGG